jgi:phosphoglucosamine mutase
LINVPMSRGFDWKSHTPLLRTQQEVEAELGAEGRILIRPSGTEPLLRVMVEARSKALADQVARRLADCVPG